MEGWFSVFEKKRRMMMGDNSQGKPQDKPQERQLESDKKEVASSATDSNNPTPKFSSPVKRVPKKPKEAMSYSSTDQSAAMYESFGDTGGQYDDWADNLWKEVDGIHSVVEEKLKSLYNYCCRVLDSVSKSGRLALDSGNLPEFGYLFYNMETREMEITFDEGVANRYANGAPVSKGRVRWDDLNGESEEEDEEDEDENKEEYFF